MSRPTEFLASPVYGVEMKRALRVTDSLSFDFNDDIVTLRLFKRATESRDPFRPLRRC
jgi:hypothetical protein